MGSELIFRGHETQPMADGYSPKPPKPWLSVVRPIRYMLREQRLLFTLVGIAIATVVFLLLPSSPAPYTHRFDPISDSYFPSETTTQLAHRVAYAGHGGGGFGFVNSGGKVPLGLKRKGLRIVVTGGAGFVGSHLVDRLIRRGDSVIVVDNFFTGRKENVMHHFGNPRFELIRHDVVEPLLLEVDQIYHLACPASPVHYKFNPVKTIISFFHFRISIWLFCCLFFFHYQMGSFVSVLVFMFVLSLIRIPQDQCGGHPQHARPGQESRCALPANQHQRGLRRPPPTPPGGDLLGQRQPHR